MNRRRKLRLLEAALFRAKLRRDHLFDLQGMAIDQGRDVISFYERGLVPWSDVQAATADLEVRTERMLRSIDTASHLRARIERLYP